jgi:hypothetical protein
VETASCVTRARCVCSEQKSAGAEVELSPMSSVTETAESDLLDEFPVAPMLPTYKHRYPLLWPSTRQVTLHMQAG